MREELQHTDELPEIVGKIVESYGEGDPACHLEVAPLPGRDEVERVIARLREILFPGYFGDLRVSRSSILYRVGERMGPLYRELCEVIWKALRHECKRLGSVCTHCEERAEQTSLEFLRRIPAIRDSLAQDILAEFEGDPAAKSCDEIVFSYPAVDAISTYR
ncbi:MAG: serine acetyltransferase, partial [Planctomycetes bacterium]|nr:serine acetyltransferase [Planctomycetota bacterium]